MGVASTDTLGFGRLVPGPGWVVLDAARDQRFTGELVLIADEAVRVYLERGRIYLAERATDPALAERLVECGALTQEQLDYGRLDIAGVDHLGRLFDRVPTASRDAVMVATEMMNEQAVSWLAAQRVQSVGATPYRHHGSGIHRWNDPSTQQPYSPWPAPAITLPNPHPTHPIDTESAPAAPAAAPRPGVGPRPLDEPAPASEPASATPAAPSTGAAATADAPLATASPTPEPPEPDAIAPDESAPPAPPSEPAGPAEPQPAEDAPSPADDSELPPLPTRQVHKRPAAPASPSEAAAPAGAPDGDIVVTWDSPGPSGLPIEGGARPKPLVPTALDTGGTSTPSPDESFGVIWPTGEVAPLAGNVPNRDNTSPDAVEPDALGDPDREDRGTTDGAAGADDDTPTHRSVTVTVPDPAQGTEAIAVRRAVATIDTGSLAARRRLVASTQSPAPGTPPPADPVNPAEPTSATAADPGPGDDTPGDAVDTGADGRPTKLRRVLDNLRRD